MSLAGETIHSAHRALIAQVAKPIQVRAGSKHGAMLLQGNGILPSRLMKLYASLQINYAPDKKLLQIDYYNMHTSH